MIALFKTRICSTHNQVLAKSESSSKSQARVGHERMPQVHPQRHVAIAHLKEQLVTVELGLGSHASAMM